MSVSYKKSWVFCLSGAFHALNRVDDALAANETDPKVLQPLAEALWWVNTADESLMEEYSRQWWYRDTNTGTESGLRAGTTALDHLKGLKWARNRITHQLCHWNLAKPPFLWADAETIAPSGSVDAGRDHGRSEYKTVLQGKDAREALRLVMKQIKAEATGKLSA